MMRRIRGRSPGTEAPVHFDYYYAEGDMLAGHYYHAAMGQIYEVIFVRKETF